MYGPDQALANLIGPSCQPVHSVSMSEPLLMIITMIKIAIKGHDLMLSDSR